MNSLSRVSTKGTAVAMALAALLIAGCGHSERRKPDPDAQLREAADSPANWVTHGGTYAEQRYANLAHIDATNVARLGLAWSYDFDTNRGQESTPLVVDGVMYATTAWSKVVALNAATGEHLWTFDPQVPGDAGFKACCDAVNRGAAYYDGLVFVGTLDGRLIGIDAKTGKQRWSVVTVDTSRSYTITGAPRVVKGRVIIGNGGAEYGVRGYVTAYDARTGEQAWRFYTVPGDPAKGPDGAASDDAIEKIARPTWAGEYWQYGAGGTVWDSIVYDAELDQLLIGVGNGSPWNHRIRSAGQGDNLFLSSIVALDPDTGAYRWHYQQVPGDMWDFTATQQMTLTDLTLDGRVRKVVLHAPKNGFFYVVDRTNGKVISAEKFAPVNWAERVDLETGRPVEAAGARFEKAPFFATSGASGAHNWQPMSYSPRTGLVYLPAQMIGFLYVDQARFAYRPGLWNLGVDMMAIKLPELPADRQAMMDSMKGWLAAWDPVAQREVWRVEHGGPWNGGTLVTAGDLVFQGTASGEFRAYDARDGRQLWKFDAQTGVIAGPISYSVDGVQYVAVMAGYGGGVPLALPSFAGPKPNPPGRVLVFRIDGKATLPPHVPVVRAPVTPDEAFPADVIAAGANHYADLCAGCHGMQAYSAGVLPDLRRSPSVLSRSTWNAIVIGGALEPRGMIGFSKYLDAEQAETIRAYIASEAVKLVAGQAATVASATAAR